MRTRRGGWRGWLARRVLLSLALGAATTIASALWFAARGEPRLGAERWSFPRGLKFEDGTTYTRVHTRSNARALERSWQDEVAGAGRFGDCGGNILSDLLDRHVPGPSPWGTPHGPEAWGSLPLEREEYSALLRTWFTGLPGTQGYEKAYGWPRLALANGHYTSADRRPLGRGWNYQELYPGGRWLGGFMVPLTPIWPGLVFNTMFFGAGWLALLVGGFVARDWLCLRIGRCPHCRYDLRHDFSAGCPECGWRREGERCAVG